MIRSFAHANEEADEDLKAMYDCYGNKSSHLTSHCAQAAKAPRFSEKRNSTPPNPEISKSALIFQDAGG
jgi:hypothetical protein